MDKVYYMKYVLSGMMLPTDLPRLFEAIKVYLHGSLAVLLMFYIGLWTIKINFLIFFKQLGYQITYYRVYWWGITIFTVIAGAACIGDIQYDCLAVTVQESMAKCAGPAAIKYQDITLKVNCALDVLTDVLIMSLPISILWNVRISFTRKVQLAGLFSLVVVTMVISIVRVAVVSSKNNLSTSNQVENTWLYLWHFVESAVALLVACLASFRTLFTAKSRREEDAHYRDEEAQRNCGVQKKHAWARAKHLQDSLFKSTKNDTVITKVTSVGEESMEYPLRETKQHSIDSRATDETPSQCMPTLNSHGLLVDMNNVGTSHSVI
ncbi:hypothetical protein N0V83_001915 [Neocucurbitaria cava]|uniref:Rhodopsin domain-containing protein n=1 Tax=Neocucurbitaria cava TaxID=798079 RepID=A0A9W8YGH6_9PLEO|nr:hypothetical protein N0V83_001915 [Neocucurbitaria cava]